jgi:hypothetical protein
MSGAEDAWVRLAERLLRLQVVVLEISNDTDLRTHLETFCKPLKV